MGTGPEVDALEQLWWLSFGVTCVVYALVLGTVGVATLRRREPEIGPAARASSRVVTGIAIAAAVTTLALLVLLTAGTLAGPTVAAWPGPQPSDVAARGLNAPPAVTR